MTGPFLCPIHKPSPPMNNLFIGLDLASSSQIYKSGPSSKLAEQFHRCCWCHQWRFVSRQLRIAYLRKVTGRNVFLKYSSF